MTCRDVVGFLDQYLAGELPRVKRWIFEVHLALCRDCRNYLASYQRTIALCRKAHEPVDAEALGPVPEELVQTIMSLRATSNGPRSQPE